MFLGFDVYNHIVSAEGAVRWGADFFLASHNKVSRLPLFYYESMKRPLYALGAARQGEGE